MCGDYITHERDDKCMYNFSPNARKRISLRRLSTDKNGNPKVGIVRLV